MRYRFLVSLLAGVGLCIGCQAPPRTTVQSDAPAGSSPAPAAPKAGEAAPLFTLKTLDQTKEIDLSRFAGDRPVLLFFGSYT